MTDAGPMRRPTKPKPALQATLSAPRTGGMAPVRAGVRKGVFGPKSVGSFVPGLTRQAFNRFGFSAATLVTDWTAIVGADLAGWTEPERLKWPRPLPGRDEALDSEGQSRPGATLVLKVEPGRALDVQYKARQILERINAYFGYRAVAELRILQAPLQRPPAVPPPVDVAGAAPPRPDLATIDDPGLKAALERMAAGLAARDGRAGMRR